MKINLEPFNADQFKATYCKSSEQIAERILNCSLETYYDHYIETHYEKLQCINAELLSTIFNDLLDLKWVNSMKSRVKNPYHVVDKLIRKVLTDYKYRNLTIDNYHLFFDDLLGSRLILLYLDDWYNLHEELLEHFPFNNLVWSKGERINTSLKSSTGCIISKPEINIRNGDDETVYFSKIKGSKTIDDYFSMRKGRYYRSIHYSIAYQEYLLEVQVRSVFDEAWSEVDHDVLYPKYINTHDYVDYSKMLNRITGLSNEMASYFKNVIINDNKHGESVTLKCVPDELQQSHLVFNSSKGDNDCQSVNCSVNDIVDDIVKGEII